MAEGSLEKGFILDPEAKMKSRIDEQSELICILKLGFKKCAKYFTFLQVFRI